MQLREEDKKIFFNYFGYLPNDRKDAGHINYYKNAKGKLISYKRIVDISGSLVKEYEYKNNPTQNLLQPIDIQAFILKKIREIKDDESLDIFEAWQIFNKEKEQKVSDSEREKISRYYTKNTKKYLINRRILFFFVLYLNLNLEYSKSFFSVYDCKLGATHLIEDKSLIRLLNYGSNLYFKEKIAIFLK